MGFKKTIVNLMPNPLVKVFAAPYVAGTGLESGLTTAERFWEEDKLHSTIDLLGEEVYDHDEVEGVVSIYLEAVKQLRGRSYATVSLKPTQLGIFESEGYCLGNMRKIISAAGKHNLHVTIDMEDHPYTDVTLRFFHELREEFDNVGTVLQSRLFRTRDDILSLPKKPCKIRTCIGIYSEPADIALQKKSDMKEQLFQNMQLLLENGHYPEIATHDVALINRCLNFLKENKIPSERYEFQMLMGVPRKAIQKKLLNQGEIVRLYVPFAEKWKYALAYCKRRLSANPMMAAYVLKNIVGKSTGR
ncbi:MAG: proline dehydrogenase [Acidobacteria bacterium]|nr:proline dehydrogenase [Acidobacteriota bacterium]